MLTIDDLNKLRSVIREEVGASETRLKGLIREEISGSESKLREEITSLETKMEHRFNAVDKRFDGTDKRLDGIEQQMEQDRKDWSGFFNEAGIFFDEMRNGLAKRIKKLEENQRLNN